MFDVNVLGLFNGMYVVLVDMKDCNYGMIVNISFIVGKKIFLNYVVYCGIKFVVYVIFENVCEEVVVSNVCVIIIVLGVVEIELFLYIILNEIKEGYDVWKVDMGGVLVVDDVVCVVLFVY